MLSLFSPRKWPFFYGYWIVVCTVLGLAMSAPGQTIGVSVFTDALIEHLGLTRLSLSTTYMVGTVLSSLLIVRVGTAIDRRGARWVAASAAAGLGLTLVVLSQVDRVAQKWPALLGLPTSTLATMITVTGAFLCLRFFGQGALTLASRTMLMKWFRKNRGKMNSLAGIAMSLTFSASPWFFEVLIVRFGWRGAWLVMAVVVGLGMSLFAALFFRDDPESCGLLPDGGSPDGDAPVETLPEEHWALEEARKTYSFRIFNLGLSLFSLYATALVFHIVSIFDAAGFDRRTAVSIFVPAAMISITLQTVSGWLSDRYSTLKYYLMIFLVGILISAFGALNLELGFGKPVLILGNGITGGMFSTLISVTWPRFFGRRHLGAIGGLNMSWLVFSSAIGPFLFALSEDRTGDYGAAIAACAAAAVVLLLLSFRADNPQRPSGG